MARRKTEERRKFFRSLEAKSLRSRSFSTRVADSLTALAGSPGFLFLNVLFFAVWIVINTEIIPGMDPFDPFPFSLLTTIVSLEAIVLSIFVLISQSRTSYIGTIRDEVHMNVNLTAEQEITKILEILSEMRKKMNLTDKDPELERMLEQINQSNIEHNIAEQITRADKGLRDILKREFPELLDVVRKPAEVVEALLPTPEKSNGKLKS